jgi:hypothetical protein
MTEWGAPKCPPHTPPTLVAPRREPGCSSVARESRGPDMTPQHPILSSRAGGTAARVIR